MKKEVIHQSPAGGACSDEQLGPILAGAPCLGYPGKEGLHQKTTLDRNENDARDKVVPN